MFSAETEAKFKHLASIYPRKRSALIPMLLAAQSEQGYIKDETVEYIGRKWAAVAGWFEGVGCGEGDDVALMI